MSEEQSKHQTNEEQKLISAEIVVSKVLRIGVLVSGLVILIGLILYLVAGESGYPADTYPTTLRGIIEGAGGLKPAAVILLGLFLLILTPVLRVGITILVFVKAKDYLYVGITSLVFVILIISLLLGKAG
ncbi:DUF1634 domain-containing protein [Paenibacillus guangzhouensis]|uniref:DUF1634 domain-containing protein n=1 Tax=Paenibacillus guangzhouensis TaxID=1473112 RepID=UPI001266DD27|nr:DUF1634 domain-containing protein [Paenibacillus guangzhouensis]